jgi:hypothetical protein
MNTLLEPLTDAHDENDGRSFRNSNKDKSVVEFRMMLRLRFEL